MKTYFVSGHTNLTPLEFMTHYAPKLQKAFVEKASFVVGDDVGADQLAQSWLASRDCSVTVYHLGPTPKHNRPGFPTQGDFEGLNDMVEALLQDSDEDIAWVRPGSEMSLFARNLKKRGRNEGG